MIKKSIVMILLIITFTNCSNSGTISGSYSGGIAGDTGKEEGTVAVPSSLLVQSLATMNKPNLTVKSTEAIIRIILLFRTFKCLKFIIVIFAGIRRIIELDGS